MNAADPSGLCPDDGIDWDEPLSMRSGHPGMHRGTYQSNLAQGMTRDLENTLEQVPLAVATGGGSEGLLLAEETAEATAEEAAADEIYVIGRQVDTEVAKDWPGYTVLDDPNWNLGVNDDWVQNGIDRNLIFYTASPRTIDTLYDTINERNTVYLRELTQMAEAGYRFFGDYLLPPMR